MERFCFFTRFLPVYMAASFSAPVSNAITAGSQSLRVAGVFMFIEGGKYTLNFTSARDACLFRNVTMATSEQMERALQAGLETCKFGWIAEQIAVIPRITSDKNCGKGKTGVAPWSVSLDRKFGVFCFNASDLEQTMTPSAAAPQTSTSPTTAPPLTQTHTTSPVTWTTSSRPRTTTLAEQTSPTEALTPLVHTTPATIIPSTATSASLDTSSTRGPTSVSHAVTSETTYVATYVFATSASVPLQSVNSAKPSLGAVPTALIIASIILLLLTATGFMWYYKLNVFTFWSAGQQKDDTETEMWKHTDSEMDLYSEQEAEDDDDDEESHRKYSSDITLCVKPDIRANSSE